MQNQVNEEKSIKNKKYYGLKNSGITNIDPIETNNNSKTREVQEKCPDNTAVITHYTVSTRETEQERP